MARSAINFPESCPDGAGPCGCDRRKFYTIASAEIPDLPEEWQYAHAEMPPDALTILDLLEFSARNIANPIKRGYHGFFGHYHLDFQRDEGLKEFVADVNRLLARNGIGFELTAEGKAMRLGPALLRDALANALFHSGDIETDRLLEEFRVVLFCRRTSKIGATASRNYGTLSSASKHLSLGPISERRQQHFLTRPYKRLGSGFF